MESVHEIPSGAENLDIEWAIHKTTIFLENWYPPEVAPHVVKRQLQATGAAPDEITEKDINLLLSRLQVVVLPSFMSKDDARKNVRVLKRELGIRI